MNIVIINGPNLNFLGIREPDIYGSQTWEEMEKKVQNYASNHDLKCAFFQSNSEGAIINRIQQAYADRVDGIIINPAAYTHYSYAIHDAIKAVNIPAVEVHLSAIQARESFRKESVIAPACIGQISGFGEEGYILALHALKELNERSKT